MPLVVEIVRGSWAISRFKFQIIADLRIKVRIDLDRYRRCKEPFITMMPLLYRLLLLTLVLAGSQLRADGSSWVEQGAQGETLVHLYFFWSQSCPHCQAARPFVSRLPEQLPWLRLHSHDVAMPEYARKYLQLAETLGGDARSVPGFLFCGRMIVGYHQDADSGQELVNLLKACHESGGKLLPPVSDSGDLAAMPWLGWLDPQQLSLPVFTLVIAGLDAFNPCAFFVLLFLLSLLVNARARGRMLFIGGIFVLFSGLMYFLFMAAWLNLFLWLGELRLVTLVAGAVAVLMALVNIKDYFWFKQGPSLSIPDSVKPGLFQRMRGLLRADNLGALTLGTIVLAVVANSYELLCTAGFPMVYTRYLTLAGLGPVQHYLYLGLYNLIYVLPLLAIVLIFVRTLGRRKLSESEGRLLKLISGFMMLGLGFGLVFKPELINNPMAAIGLLATALLLAWLVHRSRTGSVG